MDENDRPLSGRMIAITGGARGIGLATAAALHRRGARLAIGDLDGDLAAAEAGKLGGDAIGVALDVTDRESFAALLDQAEERLGPLYGLINNAGIMPVGLLHNETELTARRVIDVNVNAVITGTKLALERMRPRESGHIINIASQAGKVPLGGVASYCASKHAVVGFTGALADELRHSRIEATCVLPGVVKTELTAGLPQPRLLKPIEPAEVGEAIAHALIKPRRVVHVPRTGAAVLAVMGALPPRARRALETALGMKDGVMGIDPARDRGEYEARAARELASDSAEEPVPSEDGAGLRS